VENRGWMAITTAAENIATAVETSMTTCNKKGP
jgi:hypothetical protein